MMIITAEVIGSLVIRYIHFFSSIMWWGAVYLCSAGLRALNTYKITNKTDTRCSSAGAYA